MLPMSLVFNANRLPRKKTLTKTGGPSRAAAHLSADPPGGRTSRCSALAVHTWQIRPLQAPPLTSTAGGSSSKG